MERKTDTIRADTLQWCHNSWEAELFHDGAIAYDQPVYVEGPDVELDGAVRVEFGEYFTTLEAEMEVEISYVEREYEGEPYTEDHRVESVDLIR